MFSIMKYKDYLTITPPQKAKGFGIGGDKAEVTFCYNDKKYTFDASNSWLWYTKGKQPVEVLFNIYSGKPEVDFIFSVFED